MDLHGEAVLRQRACVGCHAVFWICGHCDRGQRYCSSTCQAEARRGQRRRANRRHQRSPEGRLDHRDRQREYRRRRAGVTDQGSQSISSPAKSGCGTSGSVPVTAPARLRADFVQCPLPARPAPFLRCVVWPEQPFRRSFPAKTALWKREKMISPETHVQIRRNFYAEHWKSARLHENSAFIPMPFAMPSNRTASTALSRYAPLLPILPWSLFARPSASIRGCAPRAFIRRSMSVVTPEA